MEPEKSVDTWAPALKNTLTKILNIGAIPNHAKGSYFLTNEKKASPLTAERNMAHLDMLLHVLDNKTEY